MTTFYTFDERGNVSQRLTNTGWISSTDAYDSYGTRSSTVSAQPDPWGYEAEAGYYTDTETGLILCTHRFYDPGTGRWLTRDPIEYSGGVNLYGYVGNDPGNGVDPSGELSPDCQSLLEKIVDAAQTIYKRWNDLRNDSDPENKFPLYPYGDQPNPGAPDKGTWEGHKTQLQRWKTRLNNLLNEWRNGPCGGSGVTIAAWVVNMASVAVPNMPKIQP